MDKTKEIHFEHLLSGHATDTIVLIHCNAADMSIFDWIVPYLRQSFHVVRYDLRGYGQSDRGDDPLTLDRFANDLYTLMNKIGLTKVHLAGLQLGALISIRFAHLYKERVSSLVLMSIPCFPPDIIEKMTKHRLAIRPDGSDIPTDYILRQASTLPNGHPALEQAAQSALNADVHVCKEITQLTMSSNPLHELASITQPTFIISGAEDVFFPYHYLHAVVREFSHCHSIVMPNTSSLLVIDDPKMLSSLITTYFQLDTYSTEQTDPFLANMKEAIQSSVTSLQLPATKVDATLKIKTADEFTVSINDINIKGGWNKRYATSLLLFLVLHPSASREQICDALWPDIPITTAKKNLRVYLVHLRSLLNQEDGETMLEVSRERIYLNATIKCDLLDLLSQTKAAILESQPSTRLTLAVQIERALQTIQTPVLYEDWYLTIWRDLQNHWISLFSWSAKELANLGNFELALQQLLTVTKSVEDELLIETALDIAYMSQSQLLINKWTKTHDEFLSL
ncbi:alpha/beta hydrolase [Alkalicoccobacillus murimartini]|uniref:Pimeloyl-ACP methyl ester carboxylesterase/DNA-binding SARP family transcriptional activator n=1 Tax=Alkalicoccobacillus murimartini TaxID=171685 RepID=A0ABT9YJX8_9BACI|nr:alpha/beta hydrolase [Alkalicoccobacillus murimartini]MDQ0207329.1 pimeloyl-ACP methyl ester carboxylesterase/DNA-binding SARP family transcriptional activator [Alkalicoccobacillus murimartini]